MNMVLLGVIAVAIVVLVIFLVQTMLSLKKSLAIWTDAIEETKKSVVPVLTELELTLKSVRKIADDVGVVTDEARELSGSLKEIGEGVRRVGGVVTTLTAIPSCRLSGLSAGVKAGFSYLISHMFSKES